MRKKTALSVACLAIAAVCLVLYGINSRESVITRHISYDFHLAPNIEDMVKESDFIVVGEYTEFLESFNAMRDMDNPAKEDPYYYAEAHLYHFKVTETVKGQLNPQEIKVALARSMQMDYQDSKYMVDDPFYIEPQIGQTYILFLDYVPLLDHYTFHIEPKSIAVDQNGITTLESTLLTDAPSKQYTAFEGNKRVKMEVVGSKVELSDLITGKSLDAILQEIKTYQ